MVAAFLISNPWRGIIRIDDATFYILMFFKYVLHDFIILMCVDADIVNLRFAVIKSKIHNAAASAVGSNPVNNTIRFIVQPIPIFYDGVGRIPANHKGENSAYFIIFCNKKTIMSADIGLYGLNGGAAIAPLIGISVLFHLNPGIRIYSHHFF
jgi:hypothetical protein